MAASGITIRDARPSDAEEIARIHNQGIEERVATFETRVQTAQDGLRRLERSRPLLIAELDGALVGWIGAGPYDAGSTYYAGVGEVALYVDRSARRRGVGRALLDALPSEAAGRGRHKLLGKIFTSNTASIELFESCGYRQVGVHERHGLLDGEWKDVIVVERSLEEP